MADKSKERQTNAGGAQRRTWDLEEYERRARERYPHGTQPSERFFVVICDEIRAFSSAARAALWALSEKRFRLK